MNNQKHYLIEVWFYDGKQFTSGRQVTVFVAVTSKQCRSSGKTNMTAIIKNEGGEFRCVLY